jgi:hypothetical protein
MQVYLRVLRCRGIQHLGQQPGIDKRVPSAAHQHTAAAGEGEAGDGLRIIEEEGG